MRKRITDAWRVLKGEYIAQPRPQPFGTWFYPTTYGTNTTVTPIWIQPPPMGGKR